MATKKATVYRTREDKWELLEETIRTGVVSADVQDRCDLQDALAGRNIDELRETVQAQDKKWRDRFLWVTFIVLDADSAMALWRGVFVEPVKVKIYADAQQQAQQYLDDWKVETEAKWNAALDKEKDLREREDKMELTERNLRAKIAEQERCMAGMMESIESILADKAMLQDKLDVAVPNADRYEALRMAVKSLLS